MSMFLGFFAWYAGLARGGVARIGQVQLAQPVLSLGWAALVPAEVISVAEAVTAAVVLACVAWSPPNGPARRLRAMVRTAAVGTSYPPVTYAAGREGIRSFALAVGETDPLHLDPAAARAAGWADVVAPPMYAVVYAAPALGPALFDPAVGMDFSRMVHGGQEFAWGPLVVAGDELTTTVTVASIEQRGDLGFFVFTSSSTNQTGQVVCVGTWTNIVRGVSS